MTKYNVNFELTVDDVELIEAALRLSKQELSGKMLAKELEKSEHQPEGQDGGEVVRRITDLLGRLHNQKVFYRPRTGAYIGG